MEVNGFEGFRALYYTMVPNEIFDTLMDDMSGAELKVVLYVCRRTFGFGKVEDCISLTQMLRGVVTRDGRRLDRGCGIKSRSTLLLTLRELAERNILRSVRRQSEERGFESTLYCLNMAAEAAAGEVEDPLGPKIGPRGVGPKISPTLGPKIGPTLGTKIGPSLGPKIDPTTNRSSKSIKRKHQHAAAAETPSVPDPAGPGPRAGDAAANKKAAASADSSDGVAVEGLVARMVALGLAPRLAAQKAAAYPAACIQQALDALQYRRARNPVGYFLAELQAGGFTMPQAQERETKQRAASDHLRRQVAVQQARDADTQARIEAAVASLDPDTVATLNTEACQQLARQLGRPVAQMDAESPWVRGMFEAMVEQRYCQAEG